MPDSGTLTKFTKLIGLLQGVSLHLHKLGEHKIGEVCLNAPAAGYTLQCEGTWSVSWANMEPSSGPPGQACGVRKNMHKNFEQLYVHKSFISFCSRILSYLKSI